jgi:hypothetical protein
MAGVAGLEPAHARIKTLCLTDLATPQSLKFFSPDTTAISGALILTRRVRHQQLLGPIVYPGTPLT